jgi:hypothetical protein
MHELRYIMCESPVRVLVPVAVVTITIRIFGKRLGRDDAEVEEEGTDEGSDERSGGAKAWFVDIGERDVGGWKRRDLGKRFEGSGEI